ncbi:phage tail protein [Conexibacter arvalis]|uniref:Microcystin-dependent protein n=1 Tax=Conexibacter arvalis TaxID=912552 RepID=A0A840IG30_9ACTN|nr:tail fiber protein [Conexibacter arvalis]MBB4663769.1 microcystin-dependent protein [Conexibacter arvalis]
MTDPFLAEIRVFGFNYAPSGWAACDGQEMPIAQNTALFSLLGTDYGGDGKSTFALPDLRGAAAIGVNSAGNPAPGAPTAERGERLGSATVTLLESEIPAHDHAAAAAATVPADLQGPASDRALARSTAGNAYQSNTSGSLVPLSPQALAPAGGTWPHNNRPPSLAFRFCIALQGVFPQRW